MVSPRILLGFPAVDVVLPYAQTNADDGIVLVVPRYGWAIHSRRLELWKESRQAQAESKRNEAIARLWLLDLFTMAAADRERHAMPFNELVMRDNPKSGGISFVSNAFLRPFARHDELLDDAMTPEALKRHGNRALHVVRTCTSCEGSEGLSKAFWSAIERGLGSPPQHLGQVPVLLKTSPLPEQRTFADPRRTAGNLPVRGS